MSRRKIIIPSESPGGLSAAPCEHFGQCPVFTMVTVEENSISAVEVIPNDHVGCRNCFDPIKSLWERGMSVLLVYKLGLFPLRVLDSLGIPVHHLSDSKTVEEAVKGYLQNQLRDFSAYDTCSGECEH